MILAFDTSSEACTAALFDEDGECLARADERIGRGHAEFLVPMLDTLLGGRRPDRIVVGVGPGSFTGIRVAIAAAQGLSIGWGCPLDGMNSLALLAASVTSQGEIAAAVLSGHGQLFVQSFDGQSLAPVAEVRSLTPAEAAQAIAAHRIVGSGAEALVHARGHGEAISALPAASNLMRLPIQLRSLPPRPVYVRPPDAKVKAKAAA